MTKNRAAVVKFFFSFLKLQEYLVIVEITHLRELVTVNAVKLGVFTTLHYIINL